MDLISADHTAEVRSSTAESLIKASVQSFGLIVVPKTSNDMLRLDDARPGRANRSVLQMRGSLEGEPRPHSAHG